MAEKRKIKCDCGKVMSERKTIIDNIETEAMVCPGCGFITLTKPQAERFSRLKLLHSIIDAERKIIRVGNSMGITLPESLGEFGVKIGKKVRTRALDEDSFIVQIV